MKRLSLALALLAAGFGMGWWAHRSQYLDVRFETPVAPVWQLVTSKTNCHDSDFCDQYLVEYIRGADKIWVRQTTWMEKKNATR